MQIPELLEHMLSFFDAYSIASLASVHQPTTKVLQERKILDGKTIRRSKLPLSTLNEGTLEQQRQGIRLLVNLLLKLENGKDLMIDLLLVICENCPGVDQSNRVRVSDDGIHLVSPLGVVLLEEAERPFASSLFGIREIRVENLKDPLLTALGSRLARHEEEVENLRLSCRAVEFKNTSQTGTFITLMQKCPKFYVDGYIHFQLFRSIRKEGWIQLAEASRLAMKKGGGARNLTFKTSKTVLQEARLEDLRAIWDLQEHFNWLVLSRREGAVQLYSRATNSKTKEESWLDLVALWEPS